MLLILNFHAFIYLVQTLAREDEANQTQGDCVDGHIGFFELIQDLKLKVLKSAGELLLGHLHLRGLLQHDFCDDLRGVLLLDPRVDLILQPLLNLWIQRVHL